MILEGDFFLLFVFADSEIATMKRSLMILALAPVAMAFVPSFAPGKHRIFNEYRAALPAVAHVCCVYETSPCGTVLTLSCFLFTRTLFACASFMRENSVLFARIMGCIAPPALCCLKHLLLAADPCVIPPATRRDGPSHDFTTCKNALSLPHSPRLVLYPAPAD